MLEIRPAALAEFSLLPAIEAESDELLASVRPLARSGALPAISGAEEFAGALHVLVAGRPPVGFVRLEEVDGQPHLEQLSVVPQFAGQGIGRSLVNAAVAWAREAGYRYITLCTFSDIPFNAPFYASCGFAPENGPGAQLADLPILEKDRGLNDVRTRIVMKRSL